MNVENQMGLSDTQWGVDTYLMRARARALKSSLEEKEKSDLQKLQVCLLSCTCVFFNINKLFFFQEENKSLKKKIVDKNKTIQRLEKQLLEKESQLRQIGDDADAIILVLEDDLQRYYFILFN